jgi:hypothetical protein
MCIHVQMFAFQFVNYFCALFYIGFYLMDMSRLSGMLLSLSVTRQVRTKQQQRSHTHCYDKFTTVRMCIALYQLGFAVSQAMCTGEQAIVTTISARQHHTCTCTTQLKDAIALRTQQCNGTPCD